MRTTYLSILLSASLLAGTIEFENAPRNAEHALPNNPNQILSFNTVLKESMDAVVNISTKTIIGNQKELYRLYNDPFFQKFLEQRGGDHHLDPQTKKQDHSLGSGVVVSKDGYIVTNYHVIEGADEIVVTFKNSDKEYIAKLIGSDKGSDLAVVKIEAKELTPISLSHQDDVKLGDVVFAIGNPFGVGQTITQGIISAMNKNHVGINQYENFIQTDASINPGNSGGALIDSRGALIGINSAILSSSGGNNGIGFAIPISMVKNIVTKLIQSGKVYRGFMGVNIIDISQKLEPLYSHRKGAIITDIQIDSPAEIAKLQRGDLIYEVNGKKVDDTRDLQRLVSSFTPDEVIKLSIERDKKEITKEITLISREYTQLSKNHIAIEGLYLSQLTEKIRIENQIPINVTGLLIEDIVAGSEAHLNGFRPKDILIQVENIKIENIDDIKNAFKRYKNIKKRIYINRGGSILLLVTK